jgi:phage shock protein E
MLSTLIGLLFSSTFVFSEEYWIDVRTDAEYQQGHVDIAVNYPFDEIAGQIANLTTDKDAKIYVYCRSGTRASKARQTLLDLGYSNVENVGGLQDAIIVQKKQHGAAVTQ